MNNFLKKLYLGMMLTEEKTFLGKRKIPTKFGYRVMLQQTQVSTVIPYFNKFISCFPKIDDLAVASLDEILSIWSGLGYYTRAKNIHKTAIILREDFDSKLPNNFEDLVALPGIGFSTAGAILSLGFKKPGVILMEM